MPLKALNVSKKLVISQVNLTSGKMAAERQPNIRTPEIYSAISLFTPQCPCKPTKRLIIWHFHSLTTTKLQW